MGSNLVIKQPGDTTGLEALAKLCDLGIIDSESQLAQLLSKKIDRAYSKMRYELCEELAIFPSNWRISSTYALAYSILVDFVYDEELPIRRRIRLHQGAAMILTWLAAEASVRPVSRSAALHEHLQKQSLYQILEREWGDPSRYAARYLDLSRYHEKQNMYLYPIQLLAKDARQHLSSVYRDFFIFELLADDIIDYTEDAEREVLSYAIVHAMRECGRNWRDFDSGCLLDLFRPALFDIQERIRLEAAKLSPTHAAVAWELLDETQRTMDILAKSTKGGGS